SATTPPAKRRSSIRSTPSATSSSPSDLTDILGAHLKRCSGTFLVLVLTGVVSHAMAGVTPGFKDDPLLAGTLVQAQHVTQLRDAIDLALAAAGHDPADYTNKTLDHVDAIDVMQMRSALALARTDLNLKPITFTDPTLSSSI